MVMQRPTKRAAPKKARKAGIDPAQTRRIIQESDKIVRDRAALLKERKELLEAKSYRDNKVMLEQISSQLSRRIPSALHRQELRIRQGELTAKMPVD